MDSDTQEALRELERNLVERLHKMQLDTSRAAGELGTLTSRFESEMGHTRRELGQALTQLDEQKRMLEGHRERHADVVMRLGELRSEVAGVVKKVDSVAKDVEKAGSMDPRVSKLEIKDIERDKSETRRDLNIRALWGGMLAAGAKLAWDFVSHRLYNS